MVATLSVSGPAPMEGGGGYNRRSSVQAAGLRSRGAAVRASSPHRFVGQCPEAIVIADYGSSEGHNSLAPMSAAIHALRARAGRDRAISVVHTDLVGNDFNALFRTLADDPDSYLRDEPATFASAIGRSFYKQILPSGSVTLGWSSWSLQWLSRAPSRIPDQVYVNASHDSTARLAYADQADKDWRAFLNSRGRELRNGGRLIVITMARHNDGDFGLQPQVKAMYEALLGLVDEGFIGIDERKRMEDSDD